MRMNMYRREFRRNLKGLLIWSAVIGAYIILLLGMYPQFAADQEALNLMLDAYPESLKQAFGMDTLNYGTALGYYGVQVYLFTTLIGSIYAALLASGILVKEESEKTIEFLLSRPVDRHEVVWQKGAAVCTNLLLLNVCLTAVSLLGFQIANDPEAAGGTFGLLALATLLLHVTVASVSFLLSSIMRKNRSIVSISLGIVFLSYAMHVAAGVSDSLSFLGEVSLFHYVDAALIVGQGALDPVYTSIMVAVSVLSVAAAFLYYKSKDITV